MKANKLFMQNKQLIDVLEKEMRTISGSPKDFKPISTSTITYGKYGPPTRDKPIGFMVHEASHSEIPVFEKIGWFKRFLFKCLGIKFRWI